MKPRLRDPVIAIAIVLVVGSIAMVAAHASPVDGFSALVGGALGGPQEIAETLVQTTALLFPALGVALALRAGLFNIGAEGQLIIGGLFAGAIGERVHAPAIVAVPLLLLVGAVAGGAWGAIAGFIKARFGASEVIATLMLNVIAVLLASYLIGGIFKSDEGSGSETGLLPSQSWLPTLLPDSRLTVAIVIAIALALGLRYLLRSTSIGYELRAAGDAPETARRAGIDLRATALWTMTAAGAIAGVGGAALVMGVLHRFNIALSPGYGFIAIAVALVGELDPLRVTVAALAFGILQSGALAMQASANVPRDVITVVEGLIIIALAGRWQFARRTKAA